MKTRLFKHTENFTSKNWKFSDNSDIFHISAQHIDCGYSLEPPQRGGSNEYPQSMFLSKNKKNNVYPCKPQFYYVKLGFKGVKIIYACFRDAVAITDTHTHTYTHTHTHTHTHTKMISNTYDRKLNKFCSVGSQVTLAKEVTKLLM